MLRDERYPLEDQCLRCEANTYLLDQSNFSDCLSCPVGATCAGGDDVTTLAGFWRQPDDWVNNWTKPRARRSTFEGMKNEGEEVPPFLERVAKEVRDISKQLNLHASPTEAQTRKRQRRQMNASVTRRPRAAMVHKCLPGDCSKNNACNRNRTGPACGVCPDGWAETSAGCEWCPPADDPGLLFLKMVVFVAGGFVGTIGYVLASWTPLMNGVPLPEFMVHAIMMAFGIDPDEQEAPASGDEDEPSEEGPSPTADDEGGLGSAGIAASHAGMAAAHQSNSSRGQYSKPKTSLLSRLRLPKLPMPKGGIGKFLRSVKKGVERIHGLIQKLYSKLSFFISGFKMVGGWISKLFGGLSWLSALAEKYKLNVHLKIIVSYVQVLNFVSKHVQ